MFPLQLVRYHPSRIISSRYVSNSSGPHDTAGIELNLSFSMWIARLRLIFEKRRSVRVLALLGSVLAEIDVCPHGDECLTARLVKPVLARDARRVVPRRS